MPPKVREKIELLRTNYIKNAFRVISMTKK
jgi:hypothetical protein